MDASQQAKQDFLEKLQEIGGFDVFLGCKSMLGVVSKCNDILPAAECNNLDLPQGSTYADAAKLIQLKLKKRAEAALRELGSEKK